MVWVCHVISLDHGGNGHQGSGEISNFICFKIKVVFTPSSYIVSASCLIIYNNGFSLSRDTARERDQRIK